MPISQKTLQQVLLAAVILTAIFFRFWHIRDYVVFLGDEGRDMIIMRNIFIEKHLPFLGPSASVGGFYLGPIYYWMAAPFLLLWHLDPVGPAYLVAILGVATVLLLYKFINEALGFWPAILASSLYGIAPLIIRYSRSSWNPNPLPFFSLLLIYFIYLGIKKKRYIYFLLAGASFGIAVQLHYLAAILFLISAIIVCVNTNFKNWPKIAFLATIGFLITFSPFLIFEIRHNFPNIRTILEFTTRGTTIGYKTTHFVWLVSNTGNILLEEISLLRGTLLTKLVFWILSAGSILGLILYRKDAQRKLIFTIGIVWFLGGILILRSYTGQIYDYYFGFMFPAAFLVVALVIFIMWRKSVTRLAALAFIAAALALFASNGFYKTPPNRLIDQTENIANFVIEKSQNQPYNFALVSSSNSDHAYRYFLEIKNRSPKQLEEIVTDQLIVICESEICAPLGNPLWEIAGFGRAEIANEWQLPQYGFKVLRLTHWPGAPSPAGKPAVKGG